MDQDISSQENHLLLNDLISQVLFDNSGELFIILDKGLIFKEYNKKFENLLGYNNQEIKGRLIFDLIHKEDLPILHQLLTNPVNVISSSVSFRFISKEGKYFWIEASIYKLSDFIIIQRWN